MIRLPRPRPSRLLFWLVLLGPLGLLIYPAGRYLYARHQLRRADDELARYAFGPALDHLERYLAFWPDDLPAQLLAARTARRGGIMEKADEHLEQCNRLGSGSADVALENELFRCQRGELGPGEEKELHEAVLRGHPQANLILEALTLGYLYTYRYPAAKLTADVLLSREPGHVAAHVWRGLVQEGMNRMTEAMDDFRRALELEPGHAEARLNLAQTMAMNGPPADAAEHFEYLRAHGHDSADVLLGLARCRRLLGDATAARQVLEEAQQRYPDMPAILRERGTLEAEAGNPTEGESWLRRALGRDPFDFRASYGLAQVLGQLGKGGEADRYRAKALELEAASQRLQAILRQVGKTPADVRLHCEAAAICLRHGQPDEALRWLRAALLQAPNDRAVHGRLADYYEDTGRADLAARERARAGKGPPAPGRPGLGKSTEAQAARP